MKHRLVLAGLVALIAWLVLKPSALDRLAVVRPALDAGPAGNTFVEVNRAILPLTPSYFAVPHRPTVVIFHDETCLACAKLDQDLEDFSRLRPDVAIRKIRITLNGNAYYQAIRDYRWDIYLMPCVLIYDRDGKLVAADRKLDDAGGELLTRWMNREAQRAAR